MQDAGCRMQDAGCRMQDAGCRMQDARCRMQDAGCKTQDAGCRMQDAERKMQDAGCRMQNPGMQRSMQNRATSSTRKSRNLYFGKSHYSRDTEVSREDQEVSRAQEIRRPRRPETWQFRDQNSRKSEEAESFEEPWDPG